MKTRKQWIAMLLMLAMLFTALPIAAFAEDEPEVPAGQEEKSALPEEKLEEPEEEQLEEKELPEMKPVQMGASGSEEEENMGSLTVQWDYGVPGKGFYNPGDKGNKVTLNFWLRAEGTGEDGNITKFWFMYNPDTGEFDKPTTVEIGREYSHKFSLNEIQSSKGETFKNCKLIAHDVDIDSNNRIYGAGNGGSKETPNDRVLYVIQNMETKTILEIEPGSIILEDDKENMMVHYWVEKSREGSTTRERVKNNRQRKEFTESRLFIKGDLDFLDGTNKERTSFRYGVIQNQFGQFSPFVEGKTDFFLGAEWADGEHKPDLDKRYTLERTGDDLTGWTFTLKSKIKEKKVEKASEEIPFDTDEIEDSTLPEGTRKVIQQGVNGAKVTYDVSYYVEDANGREETVQELGEKIEVTKPVKQIVHVGTKKVTPSTPSVPSELVEIVFNANEGAWANGETKREQRVPVGRYITIESAPMREGYKFLYWKGSKYYPGESYLVEGGHVFTAMWEKDEQKPEEKPSVDSKIKTPRGSALTAEEIAKILAGSKKVVPAIPKAGVGR